MKKDKDGQFEILDSSELRVVSEILSFPGFGVELFMTGTIFVFFTFLTQHLYQVLMRHLKMVQVIFRLDMA